MDEVQKPVLIRVVEVIEDSEKRREFWMRSVVRLKALNSGPNGPAQASNFVSRSFELSGCFANRKHDHVFIGGRGDLILMDSDGVNGMVNRAPDIVNAIASHERPFWELSLANDIELDRELSAFGIDVLSDVIRPTVEPSPDFFLECISVFLGPC